VISNNQKAVIRNSLDCQRQLQGCVEVEEVLGNSLIEKVIRKGKCTAVVTSTSVTSPADSLTERRDQSQGNAMINFRAVRDASAGDPEVVGGELPCYDRYCEKLETAAYRCKRSGVTPSLDENAHEITLRFMGSMTFKDKYKQMALKEVMDQFGKAALKFDSPLPEHDYRAVQACARQAVASIASMADKLRSKSAADESRGAGRNVHFSSARANVATSAGTQGASTDLLPKDTHGLDFTAQQKVRGKCYNCGSTEHMVRDCDSDIQKCLSTEHHCNQCPMLSTKVLQKKCVSPLGRGGAGHTTIR